MAPTFFPPTEDDYKSLAANWVSIRTLVREEYGQSIDQTPATIDLLQRILDTDLVNDSGVTAVGVVLGRIMAKNIPGLDWWAVVDEFGRNLCLRYKATTLRVNPVSMIRKRVVRRDKFVIRELYDDTVTEIDRLGQVAD